jgi:hypothetical protein
MPIIADGQVRCSTGPAGGRGTSAGRTGSAGDGGRSRAALEVNDESGIRGGRGRLGAAAGGFTGQLGEVDPLLWENLR